MTGAYKKADSEIKKPGKTLEAEVVELEIDDDSIIVEPEVFPPPPPPPPEPLPILPPEPRPGPYLGPDPIVVALAPEPHDTFPIVQSPPPTEDGIYDIPVVEVTYPGGAEAMMKFVQDNLKYPEIAIEMGIQGRVFENVIRLRQLGSLYTSRTTFLINSPVGSSYLSKVE